MASIQHVTIPEGHRIIAISDIHGNYEYLTGLLTKIGFREDDILFLVGDLIEKGPESIKTLRYIMELCRRYTVYPSCGNVDLHRVMLLEADGEEGAKEFRDTAIWSEKWWGSSIFCEMLKELGLTIQEDTDWQAAAMMQKQIREHFKEELAFLKELPTIIETQKFIFVHGGIRGERENTAELLGKAADRGTFEYLKYDNFYEEGYSYDRYVVVGHWPTVLYRQDKPYMTPIIDEERKILSLDGACGVKKEGQLNALLIDDIRTCRFSYDWYENYPKVIALEDQKESLESTNIGWSKNRIRIERGAYYSERRTCQSERRMSNTECGIWDSEYRPEVDDTPDPEYTWVIQESSGRRVRIPTRRIYKVEENGVDARCYDCTDYEPEIHAGDELYLIDRMSDGIVVKKNGCVGWYRGKYQRQKAGIASAAADVR